MTTPTQRPGGTPLGFHGPSASFLQQLLKEARASGTPTIVRSQPVPQDTPRSAPSFDGSRRRSSVWVGGTSIAQEMRDKLRAADEVRLRRTSISGNDGPSPPTRPVLRLQMPRYDAPSSLLKGGSAAASPKGTAYSPIEVSQGHETRSITSRDATTFRARTRIGGLRLPTPTATAGPSSPLADGSPHLTSPLMFCDVDSDASASPSTISPPTSALSATSTNTTLGSSNTDPSTPRVTRRSNPVKRSHDGASSSPEMLTKKSRTQTLPEARSGAMVSPDVRSPWRCSIGGDNRTLLRNSSFTERAPAPPVVMNVEGTSTFPELSSFRPGAVGPQGVPVVSTPSRSNTRRQSAMERGGSPTPAETPIYARSLHLVDTEFSIFKKSHGDESTEFPLCLYCFRQHGAFNRIKEHGYEVCDGDEALDSHYWEAYGDGTG